jgi:hypothetical protein
MVKMLVIMLLSVCTKRRRVNPHFPSQRSPYHVGTSPVHRRFLIFGRGTHSLLDMAGVGERISPGNVPHYLQASGPPIRRFFGSHLGVCSTVLIRAGLPQV